MGKNIRKSTEYIVIHCAATPPSMDIDAQKIREWHRANGWLDIGYHAVIKKDGTIENGRDIEVVGAHVRGANSKSIGVCLVGGVDESNKPEDNFTQEQFDALKILLNSWQQQFPSAEIVGHRDLDDGKACPSFDVRKWVRDNIDISPPSDVEI